MARPMPRDAPVMRAVLVWELAICDLLSSFVDVLLYSMPVQKTALHSASDYAVLWMEAPSGAPVTFDASSDARNNTAFATSSAVPRQPRGTVRDISLSRAAMA